MRNVSGSFWAPVVYLLLGVLSIQASASLAKSLFGVLSPQGVTALRLGFAALILLAVFRPWRRRLPLGALRPVLAYGMALGCMNLSFYMSIARIPLGIAVAIEFTGPLAVAAFTSRSRRELLWVGLAVAGVAPLLPLGAFSADLDPVGVGFGFCAGFFWALYMIFGKKAGMVRGTNSVALGTAVAAMIALPVGLLCEGTALFSPAVLPSGLLVGIFSSALPYGLEMLAMTRLSTQTYGVLTSLEPAMAALSGFVFLGETLTLVQWGALACVMGASLGATLTGRRE